MMGPLFAASPSAFHSCGASPQDFAHSYPHAPGMLSVHVNEHSSVILIAAAMIRVTLPIIVFTLRNGRHQWNGITQRRPSTNCSIRQITVSQISIVMVPSTNAWLFFGMNEVISPPLPLDRKLRSEGRIGSLRSIILILFVTAYTLIVMANTAVATQNRLITNTSTK